MNPADEPDVPVWDLPVRLFHWSLVVLVLSAWISRRYGDPLMRWHQWNGYAILVLVLFRLLWGFLGSETARFRQFLTGPGAVIAYLGQLARHQPHRGLGHNPAGGWSVAAMLAVLAIQGLAGLFANDDVLVKGPLAHLVSPSTEALLTTVHRFGFKILLLLVALHVGAILFYLQARRTNLILPMITGRQPARFVPPGAQVLFRSSWLALALLILAAAVVWLAIHLARQ